MSGKNDPRRFEDLSAAYALGALSDEERREFEAYLADKPDLHSEVEELGALADLLALAPEEHDPSPKLRDDLLKSIGAVPEEHPAARGALAGRRAQSRWLAAAAAVLVAVVGLLVWSVSLQNANQDLRDEVARQERVAEELRADARESYALEGSGLAEDTAGEVLLTTGGQAVLVAERLPTPPKGKIYAAWVLRDGVPDSAGLFRRDSGPTTTTTIRASLRGVQVIAVTVEPAGGSPMPTSDPVLTASVA